jgi:two-component sensor histidine kinase
LDHGAHRGPSVTLHINPNEAERLAAVRRYDILDTPPDGAFDRITRIAARLFEVPISIVSIVDEDRIWFKSHYGLDVEAIPRGPGLCASAILDNKPWVLTDAKTDPRSLTNPLVAGDFGLRFYAGVPLRTHDGHNLGTLCVIDHEPRPITHTDIEQLTDLAAVVMDELELRLAAKREVEKKEALFQEVHHRVKNNFQIVSSLLSIQSRTVPPDLRPHFEDSLQRIRAMGLLHETFYRGQHIETVDLTGYLRDLVETIVAAFGLQGRVTARIEGPPVHFNLDTGTPLALLAAEVISNACKHAFPSERAGQIAVTVEEADEQVKIRIADDGVGKPDTHQAATTSGMGHRLISNFVQQLNGSSRYMKREGGGTSFELSLPAPARELHAE